MNDPEIIKADEARVGLTLTMTHSAFKKLLKLSATPNMDGWSKAVTKLIEGSK